MRWMNRRKRSHQYLLEVRVHAEARSRARRQWLGAWLLATAIVGLCAYGLYRLGHYVLEQLLYANPQFRITQIKVETDGALTPQQVIRFAGVQVGQNIFAVNLKAAQRNLELIPQVRSVEIQRELPHRLIIRLNERIAVARLQTSSRMVGDAVFYVDRAGVVMKPIRLSDGTVIQPLMARSLPVLSGAALTDVRVGCRVESEQVGRALALLDTLQQSGTGVMLEIEQIDLSKPQHLTVVTRHGMTIRFDVEQFRPQLRRLSAILAWAQQHQRAVAHVDLTIKRGVPVTFASESRLRPTAPTRRS